MRKLLSIRAKEIVKRPRCLLNRTRVHTNNIIATNLVNLVTGSVVTINGQVNTIGAKEVDVPL